MKSDQNKLIYLFCITRELPSLINVGVASEIDIIEKNGLYVTVKYVSENIFSEENLKKYISDEKWLDVNVRNHLDVICLIMKTNTVIPFNFGTVYRSEDSLKNFISTYALEFKKTLDYLDQKEEWSVKVYCDKKIIIENISSLSQNIADFDSQIKSSSPGKAYILGKKKNEIIDKEINSIYNQYSKKIFTQLNVLCEEYRLNTILSKDLYDREEDMIVNAIFFIKKENIEKFIFLTDNLMLSFKNIGLFIEVTGPWPPYTFIKISN